MTEIARDGYSDGLVDCNPTDNPTLESLVAERYSRRQTLFGGVSAIAAETNMPRG